MVILGVDEVGRGALAGPLVVAGVCLSQPIEGLKDSKLLTKKTRQQLSQVIKLRADAWALGWVSPKLIDKNGLTKSLNIAANKVIKAIKLPIDLIILDGKHNYIGNNYKVKNLIKADNIVMSVSAASIIAKTARDDFMARQALKYPQYGFDRNVGYGTAFHINQIALHGFSPIHRLSFKLTKTGLIYDKPKI